MSLTMKKRGKCERCAKARVLTREHEIVDRFQEDHTWVCTKCASLVRAENAQYQN